jgi:hypothetical protein
MKSSEAFLKDSIIYDKMGRAKASVLPEPVCDAIKKS